MKKFTATIVFTLFAFVFSYGQGCLPEGITFTTQEEIDNFQTNYPGCTEIEGDVTINGDDITNLEGLSMITSIAGKLKVTENPDLITLEGLEGLTSIGGYLWIDDNGALTSLSGLENVTSIGGYLRIDYNGALTSLSGLDNIDPSSITNIYIINNPMLSECDVQSICDYLAAPNGSVTIENNATGCDSNNEVAEFCGFACPFDFTFFSQEQIDNFQFNYPGCTEFEGDVEIYGWEDDITNLEGLNVITSIGGNLWIYWNDSLTSLGGLESLTFVGGNITIGHNISLSSIAELQNLASASVITIAENYSLESLAGLENITSLEGLIIQENTALINLIGLEGLFSIEGDLNIATNNSLSSLTGLDNLSLVNGNLEIGSGGHWDAAIWASGNASLSNVSALSGLSYVGGHLHIGRNEVLTTLSGLENLTSIGENLTIGNAIFGLGNPLLISLEGLEGLTSIGGGIEIKGNDILASLTGLESLDPALIDSLRIEYNPMLSECDVQSICNYLAAPNGSVTIENNANGCNSVEEVEEACEYITSIEDSEEIKFTIYPNPTNNGIITITLDNPDNLHMKCFNTFGQQVHKQRISSAETLINVSTWTLGIYLAVVYEDGKPVGRTKFIIR